VGAEGVGAQCHLNLRLKGAQWAWHRRDVPSHRHVERGGGLSLIEKGKERFEKMPIKRKGRKLKAQLNPWDFMDVDCVRIKLVEKKKERGRELKGGGVSRIGHYIRFFLDMGTSKKRRRVMGSKGRIQLSTCRRR